MKNLDIRVTELTKVVEKTSGAGVKLGELMDAAAAAWDLVVQFDKICQSAVRCVAFPNKSATRYQRQSMGPARE
jgi:hypothetical protein